MKTLMMRSAFALPLLLAAPFAQADELESAADEIAVTGLRPDAHGPAGTMGDHVHKSGDLMVGLMWMHESYGGTNRQGTQPVTPAQIAAAGYTVRDSAMTMDMAMLHLMWAPSDRVTFMVVPSWMRMGMTMEGLPQAGPQAGMPGMAGMSGMSGHTLMPGETMSHSVAGIGDTQFGALVSLSRKPKLSVHAGLMASAPTGSVSRRNASGNFVHYMMQGGSGTWDLNPSLTLRGMADQFGWGAQASYLFRAEKANASGFRFGDRFVGTAWLSKPVGSRLSLSARLTYSNEGTIKGHYNGAHGHASPPDKQGNYGGERLEGALGANLMVGDRLRLGAELAVPLHQRLNGIQLPKRLGLNVSASTMF